MNKVMKPNNKVRKQHDKVRKPNDKVRKQTLRPATRQVIPFFAVGDRLLPKWNHGVVMPFLGQHNIKLRRIKGKTTK